MYLHTNQINFKVEVMHAYESKKLMLKKIQSALEVLIKQRAQILEAGWLLQHCWLTQSQPGGTARTNRKYWQVRSRQPMFNGKTVKHLKTDEVEEYKAAIERGRKLRQVERQIAKLQRKLAQLTATESLSDGVSASGISASVVSATPPQYFLQTPLQPTDDQLAADQPSGSISDLDRQSQEVKDVLTTTQLLRNSLKQAIAVNYLLRQGIDLRELDAHSPKG